MKLLKSFPLFLALIAAAPCALALAPNVDLRDLIRYGSTKEKSDARILVGRINKSPMKFGMPDGIEYPVEPLTGIGQFAVSTIEVQNWTPEGVDVFLVYSPTERQLLLNKVSLDIEGVIREVTKYDLTRDVPTAQIDILNRQMTLFEPLSGFLKVAPVSLGALVNLRLGEPQSGFRSLSLPFARALLSRAQSDLSRTEPDYYKGRPFLRVMDMNQKEYRGFTPFGIHYQIGDGFQRGFISNGCFRLRDTDLYELASMVFLSRTGSIPFSVVEASESGNLHPFPQINNWFFMPRAGRDENGKMGFLHDEHGLFLFDKKAGAPGALLQLPREQPRPF
ncbi:hypothetical protein BH10BDE1_BH10BDE1_19870 [soil metagenome]